MKAIYVHKPEGREEKKKSPLEIGLEEGKRRVVEDCRL